MPIQAERLLKDLRALAQIGRFQTGVHRPAFSGDDMAAREWLRGKLAEAGLNADIDSVGNVYGRSERHAHSVLIGSHTDTVPYGGWLDGALGVIYALEIARCFAETDGAIGVDVVSFQDEEGTFLPFLGSRAFCGEQFAAEAEAAKSKAGETLAAAFTQAGLSGAPVKRLDPRRHLAYFEAHIEQGPRLERQGLQIGVVTGIVGIKTFRIVFHGEPNHAGTTPMSMRHDAGMAAMEFGTAASASVAKAAAAETVWNVGYMRFEPGAANVVPGTAELFFQARDTSSEVLDKIVDIVRQCAQECATRCKVKVDLELVQDTPPASMSGELIEFIEGAAADIGATHMRLPSGAGHDAMVLSRYIPAAMLFVPSIGGRSHHVSENTSDEDIVRGAQVMLRALERFAASR